MLEGMSRTGPVLTVPKVLAAADSFLVVHPSRNGDIVQTDYSGATFVEKGETLDADILLDSVPTTGEPMVVMLHVDANGDGQFQFGDGVTVADAPVFEGTTLVAVPTAVPADRAVTAEDIALSANLHAAKVNTYLERALYRPDSTDSRLRALAHRWLYEIERSDRDMANFRDILADDFVLEFSSGRIDTEEAFQTWLKGPASSVAATRHDIIAFESTPQLDDRYLVNMELDWNGLTPEGGRMQARTRHMWIAVDDGGRMPRIETVSVEVVEPFRPTEWDAAP